MHVKYLFFFSLVADSPPLPNCNRSLLPRFPTGEWQNVRNTVSRAEHVAMGDIDDASAHLFHHKLRVGLGLANLADGRYRDAAKAFASVSTELTNEFSSVISAEDLATYGALLGLAAMDRSTLHSSIIDGPFRVRLELVPAMREALRHYSRAEYGQCLDLLRGGLGRDMSLDLHLHSHVPALLDMIRDRCIAQYFRPYTSVSLERMGRVFGCTALEMEGVVAKLLRADGGGDGDGMAQGERRARINAHDGTLCVEGPGNAERRARRRAWVMAANMGRQFTREMEGLILREFALTHVSDLFCVV